MEIKRGNFRFNRIVNVNEILNESALFSMNQDDIDNDAIVNGERLEEGDELIVFQNTVEPYQNERYCYIKFNTLVGNDGQTKQITINKIRVDRNMIHPNLLLKYSLFYYNKKITSVLIELLLLIVLTNAIVVGLLKLHVPLQIVFVKYTHIHQS